MVYTTQIENTKITTMLHSVPSALQFLSPCSSSVSYFCLPYHLHLSDLLTSVKNVLGLRHLAWVNESKWFGHMQVEFRDRFCCQPYSCQMGWQLQCKQNMINISLTSSNNQFSKFRILNIYKEIFVLIFLMILRTHFEASLRFRKKYKRWAKACVMLIIHES